MKRQTRSWAVSLALVGVVGCANPGTEESSEPASADAPVKAWVPGTPRPALAHAEGTEHTLEIDWVRQGGSVEDLTDHSALIIRGQVESTRYDVIRTYAQSKTEGQPTGEESGIYNDLPVTIATVRIGDVARSSLELKTAAGGTVAQGTTVDVMFPGGLLADGCTVEPKDNPLPRVGEQAVLFLTPQGGSKPMAASTMTGVYSVTGGPLGRLLVRDGTVQGEPVGALFSRVETRAQAVQYAGPDTHEVAQAKQGPSAQSWCGLPLFGYKWCRRPTNVTYTDYTGAGWPVGDAMNAWMYTGISNSLYLYWRGSGTSDVMVYENYYGYTGWYGYAWNYASGGCMTGSTVNLNDTYYSGAHYAKTVAIHEIGHTLGIAHYSNCNSIMYTDPTQCTAATTSCDAQTAAELYPY